MNQSITVLLNSKIKRAPSGIVLAKLRMNSLGWILSFWSQIKCLIWSVLMLALNSENFLGMICLINRSSKSTIQMIQKFLSLNKTNDPFVRLLVS